MTSAAACTELPAEVRPNGQWKGKKRERLVAVLHWTYGLGSVKSRPVDRFT